MTESDKKDTVPTWKTPWPIDCCTQTLTFLPSCANPVAISLTSSSRVPIRNTSNSGFNSGIVHLHTTQRMPSQPVLRCVWYDMIWYDMIWYDMTDMYDMIWYDMCSPFLPSWWYKSQCNRDNAKLITEMFWHEIPIVSYVWWDKLLCAIEDNYDMSRSAKPHVQFLHAHIKSYKPNALTLQTVVSRHPSQPSVRQKPHLCRTIAVFHESVVCCWGALEILLLFLRLLMPIILPFISLECYSLRATWPIMLIWARCHVQNTLQVM